MDAELAAAAQALAAFDPLAALKRVALRDDPQALALRGVAMAQLGDYDVSRKLLARAARVFEGSDALAHARCLAAGAEVALAHRDLSRAAPALDAAISALEQQHDHDNALFVRVQRVRCLVLLGAVADARAAHGALRLARAPARLRALAALVAVDIAVRLLAPREAEAALAEARAAAGDAKLPSLRADVEHAARELAAPVARAVTAGEERPVMLEEVAAMLRSRALVIDACRRTVRGPEGEVSLVSRPLLLTLAVELARATPSDASRVTLIAGAFGLRRVSESARVRLRVEIGRLRKVLAPLAEVEATPAGYALRSRRGAEVAVLLPPAPGEASALLALLRAGESWSTSALATAIGSSQRTVQRALVALRDEGRVEGLGRGRAQRWVARPPEGFATTLLLLTRARPG